MSIAPNESALKRRLDRFLWENDSDSMSRLQGILCHSFREFERVVIIGGLVRDFAREGRSGFNSDVDLVIDAPSEMVSDLAVSLGATPNRFGGFGYHGSGWKVDFWALETTWARRFVPMEQVEDVICSTFFDWDAVGYDLWERKLIRNDDYLDRLRSGVLDVNVMISPSTLGNMVRAIRRLVLWDVRAGARLQEFIMMNMNEEALLAIQRVECQLYETRVSTGWRNVAEVERFIRR